MISKKELQEQVYTLSKEVTMVLDENIKLQNRIKALENNALVINDLKKRDRFLSFNFEDKNFNLQKFKCIVELKVKEKSNSKSIWINCGPFKYEEVVEAIKEYKSYAKVEYKELLDIIDDCLYECTEHPVRYVHYNTFDCLDAVETLTDCKNATKDCKKATKECKEATKKIKGNN